MSDLPDTSSTPYLFAGSGLADRAKAQGIPPPQDGSVRSPALEYQIQLLLEEPEVDYCLIGWHGTNHKTNFVLLDALQKQLVRFIRNSACHDGDRGWVQMLYGVLKRTVGPEVGLDHLKQQLKAEYGCDIEEEDRLHTEETAGRSDAPQSAVAGDEPEEKMNGSPAPEVPVFQSAFDAVKGRILRSALAQGIPQEKDGYLRPPALEFQIRMLCLCPEVDYFFTRMQTEEPFKFVLDDPKAKQYWRYMRNEAFETGDPAMAWRMYEWAANATKHLVEEADLQRQWLIEYGVDVTDTADSAADNESEAPPIESID